MWKRLRTIIYEMCNQLELIMAIIVLAGIIYAGCLILFDFKEFYRWTMKTGDFVTFLGIIFNVVIGIEFFKMLTHPTPNTVIEVLIFSVARHMVIEHTTPMENVVYIMCIASLFAIKKFLYPSPGRPTNRLFAKRHSLYRKKKAEKKGASKETSDETNVISDETNAISDITNSASSEKA